jgi:hypothetical protein
MTTLKQMEANRLNAQYSTGPVTIEGKAKASQNALKHGLFAKSNLVQGELEEEFNVFASELGNLLMPQGFMESLLVERIIANAWRLKRVIKIEAEMMNETLQISFRRSLPSLFSNGGRGIMMLSRYEMVLEKSLYKSYNELLRFQGIRQGVVVLPPV